MSLMEMSFSGAILVLVILAVRVVLKNRLPKITFTALWILVLFRLLVPFSIPFSWSVYAFLPDVDVVIEQVQHFAQGVYENIVYGEAGYERYTGEGDEEDFSETSLRQMDNAVRSTGEAGLAWKQESALNQSQVTEQNPDASVSTGIAMPTNSYPSIWNIIWAAGVLLCTACFTWIYLRCYREFQMSLPINNGMLGNWYRTHPLKRKLSVRQSDQIDSPLSYGIWHPVILLPKSTKWEDGFQLRYVLEHEYVHIQHFDAALKLLMAAAVCIHWFNPMVWLMYIFFNRDLELYCDETVIRRFGEEEKSAYAMTLIEMEEEKSGLVLLGNNFSKNAIEERIRAIMKIKRTTLLDLGMAVILICGISVLFATSCKAYGDTKETSEAEKSSAASVQAYITAKENASENADISISVKEVSTRSTVVYTEEEIKKLKTELRKREKELDELIQAKEAQLSAYDDTSSVVQEIEQLKEERVSLRDVEDDLEWYDFVEEHYKEYGVHYDLPENRLYCVNTPIRYFYDEKNGGVLWADNEGQEVLEVIYDRKGNILSLSGGPAESDEEVDVFFTDEAAEAVQETSEAVKSRAGEATEVTASIEEAREESRDINIAYAIANSKEFMEYKKFGISYDKKTGYLMYDGKTIGYFMDETKPGVYTRFVDATGESGITVVRDSGKIVRIVSFPFDEITSTAETSEAAYESGDEVESSVPEEYAKFGMTSDKKTNSWMYQGERNYE